MKPKQRGRCPALNEEWILQELQSPDEETRAKAVRMLCPCHAGWQFFEQYMEIIDRLRKDPSPLVRAQALHVFEDAGEMESSGYPTNPRALRNDMLRKKIESRFRPDEDAEIPPMNKEKRRRPHGKGRA